MVVSRDKMSHFAFVFVLSLLYFGNCNEVVQELFDDYFAWKLSLFPEYASSKGFRSQDRRLSDFSPSNAVNIELRCNHFVKEAEKVLKDEDLDARTAHYVDVLRREVATCANSARFNAHLLPEVTFKYGVQTSIPNAFGRSSFLPMISEDDVETALERLAEVPRLLEGIEAALREGIEANVTFAKESMSRVDAQFEVLLNKNIEETPFLTPFRRAVKAKIFGAEEAEKNATAIIYEAVIPAFERLRVFLRDEYSLHYRPAAGLWSIPNGEAFYEACLAFHTTVNDLDAQRVHDIGLESVAELRSDVERLAKDRLGLNVTFEEFLERARNDTDLRFATKEAGLELFNSIIHEKIAPKLPTILDGDVLSVDGVYRVRVAVPSSSSGATASYSLGQDYGTFYVNLNDLNVFQKSIATTLSLHETLPGHHLQAVVNRAADLPDFLLYSGSGRSASTPFRPAKYTAHVEGWALYAEFLGHEMGLFEEDAYQLLGFYSYNLLRSARLVVDTGIHALKWTREDAIDYLLKNTAFSRAYCELQVDRYITWPGQATAYKIGEKEIRRLRAKLEEEEGDEFDLKRFHANVLFCLGPLDKLEECLKSLQ